MNAFEDECKANEEYKKLLKMANRPAEICLDGSIYEEAKINMSESIRFSVLKPGLSCTVYLVRYMIDLRSELTSAVFALVSFARIVNRPDCAKGGSLYRPRGK